MASFFSRKRHTAQPAPAPAPAPAQAPAPAANPAPAPAAQQASYGRTQQPPQRPQQPQQPSQQPPSQQSTPQPQQQQGSNRPRQDYPWSVRRLQVDAPMRLPQGLATSDQPIVTSMTGPPLPRYGHSIPLISTPSGDIFVFGGLVKDEVKDDLWMIRGVWGPDATVGPGGRRSTKEMGVVASLMETTGDAPGPRVGHKSALVSSVLIVWGGDTLAKEGERNDDGLYLLNLTTRDWTKVGIVGPAPLGRYGHAVGMCGNKFIVFGGQVDGEFLNDLWSFDLQSLVRGTSAWEQLTPVPGNEPPPRRTGHVLVTYENKIYIFGGTDGAFHYNDTWCFDMATRTWSELTCIGFIPVPREGHAAALVGDVMYVFGGRGVDGKDLGDLGSFKISNHRWYMFQNMGPQPSGRSGHAMATADGRMFVIGGESGELAPTRDDAMMVHVLDTNLIKYPESKPGQPRKPNGATSPPPQQQPQRGLGLGLSPSTEGQPRPSPDTHQRSLSNSSPEDARRMNSSPENPRRLNPSVEDAKRLEDRRGAQSVDEPRRLPEGMDRRGAQSVDEPRRLDDSWRANQVPEDVRRAQEELASKAQQEARKDQEDVTRKAQEDARRVQEEAVARKAQEDAQRRAQEELARKAQEEAQRREESRRTPEGKPARPPRRSDAESADESDRAKSPEQRGKSPVNMAAVAMRAQGGNSRSGSPAGRASPNGYLGHHRAGSELALNRELGHTRAGSELAHRTGSELAHHTRSGSAMSTSGELATLRKRDAWMRAALARAASAGFVWSEELEGLGEWSEGVADLVVGLKQQQAKLQTTLAAQIQSASDRLAEADRVKTTALQEAAFCRAKLAAYESGLDDPGKLERDRSANLERLVAAASTERSVLERTLAERTDALALQSKLREQAEERAADAIRRAEAAEEDQARTASEHAELLDRNLFLETSMRDHAEKIVVVQSNIAQNEAEHSAVAQKLEEALALREEHVRALEQTQAALAATTARADDLERQWERSRQMIQSLETDQAELRAELEARTQEAQSATQRLEHVENAWAKSREEADAHRHATTSSLGMLLDSHKDLKADEDRAVRGHVERIHAMEMELSSLRKMLKEAGNRIGESQSDLVAHQKKASAAVADATALRVQLNGLRAQLASNVAEHGRLKQELAMKEAAVKERASAASSAEVQLGMLRKYLVDNGLVVDEEDIDGEGRSGLVRAQQLENELRERIRLHQDTERELQDVSRRRDDAEARVSLLGQQLERAKSAASPSSPDAEGRVASAERRREETETRLNKRIQELDHDYQMAVKYVKGTEKMMRRMKEDYAKSKALNEKLQSELDASRGITSSEAGSRTRGATGRNTPLSDEGHGNIQGQLVESQRSLQRLTTDRNELRRQLEALQRDLEQSREDLVVAQNESSEREIQIEELEVKINQLEHSLSLARNGSDETVVERLTTENAALRREKDLLSHKVHILLDDQGGYGAEGRPISGISRQESQTSTENGMTQFDSFEDWQQRVNSRSTNHRDSEYEPSTSYLPHERTRSGA